MCFDKERIINNVDKMFYRERKNIENIDGSFPRKEKKRIKSTKINYPETIKLEVR